VHVCICLRVRSPKGKQLVNSLGLELGLVDSRNHVVTGRDEWSRGPMTSSSTPTSTAGHLWHHVISAVQINTRQLNYSVSRLQ